MYLLRHHLYIVGTCNRDHEYKGHHVLYESILSVAEPTCPQPSLIESWTLLTAEKNHHLSIIMYKIPVETGSMVLEKDALELELLEREVISFFDYSKRSKKMQCSLAFMLGRHLIMPAPKQHLYL